MTHSEAVALLALAAAVVVTPVAALVAKRIGVVDRPGALKPQSEAVPYLGGLGVFAGLLIGVLSTKPTLAVPMALAVVLGTLDDRFDLRPLIRLAGQMLTGILAACFISTRFPEAVGFVLIIGVTVLVMNGTNLIDGLDGLAGGVAAAAGGGAALILTGTGRSVGMALCAASLGFLAYNRPPAHVYLGDGGSYVLGATIAILLALAWSKGTQPEVGLSCLLVAAVPAAEVALAISRRVRSGASMLEGDRGHPYDRLVERGWPRTAAAGTYVAAEVALAAIAVGASKAASISPAIAAIAGTAVVVGALMARSILVADRGVSGS